MALKEYISDDIYTTSPTGPAYGDMISVEDRRRADELALGRIASSAVLTELNEKLLVADESMPVLGLRLSTKLGTKEFAQTYLAYGRTEPEQGLRPTREVTRLSFSPGYKAKLGLALPIDPATRGSMAYWPSYSWSEAEGSRVVGWWQHFQRDKFTAYKSDREPEINDYSDDEIEFDSRPFTVWPTGFGRFREGAPSVSDAYSQARLETREAIAAVREADPRGDSVCTTRKGDAWRHAIFIGAPAVGAALRALEHQAPRGNDLPRPLADMLEAMAENLSVSV
jgi:hypothetical protein